MRLLTLAGVLLLTAARPALVSAVEPADQPAIAAASGEGERALQSFRLPDGMKGELFAAEPLLANPVAFCIDEQGRVFVAETFRQQKGVEDNRNHMNWLHDDLALQSVEQRLEMFKKFLGDKVADYAKEQDRIRLLIDTDGDGKADTATVFAAGFNDILDGTGAGLLAHRGDVFYTCIPKLWKLRDENGDGVADLKDALHHGYGVRVAFRGHDMHGLVLGPDGRIYYSIGDRGYNVTTPEGEHLIRPDTGAVFRCEPDGSQLEVFAYGLRNPQELAFDDYGNLFTGDNNSDSGDRARWVHIVEGGDTGWRMYYQYLNDRGPWNREKIWHPYHKGQPAHIIPPVVNLADGPSGLVYYPGVGLPERYKGHFFLCDFRGGPANSGIRSFGVKPKGATFELTDSHEFLWQILGTDVDFGYDGSVYVSDWVNGWDGLGKGRIYKFTHTDAVQHPAIAEAVALMKNGLTTLTPARLIELLAHPDRRVRLEAQFTLADQISTLSKSAQTSATTDLARRAVETDDAMTGLHLIWALGQIARRAPEAAMPLLDVMVHVESPALRAQAIRTVADLIRKAAPPRENWGYRTATDRVTGIDPLEWLTKQLQDDDATVRYYAAIALGRLRLAEGIAPLLALLDANKDEDPVLRHGAVLGLEAIGHIHTDALLKAAAHPAQSGRLGVLLALRRIQLPAIERFLNDAAPELVVEAARAIYDEQMAESLPQLAAIETRQYLTQEPGLIDALVRRVLSANYRLGGREHAERIAELAGEARLSDPLRLEALAELQSWDDPKPVDRVLGDWRPLAKREAGFVAELVRPRLGSLFTGSDALRKAAADLAAKYGIREVEPALATVALHPERSAEARVAAISALAQLKAQRLDEVIVAALRDDVPEVRVEARRQFIRRNPNAAVATLADAIKSGTTIEAQSAIQELTVLKSPDSDAVLADWLERLLQKDVPAGIQLDLLDAARSSGVSALALLAAKFEAELDPNDPLAKYRVALEGGNAARGFDVFYGRSAASCRRCHSIQGSGGAVGPELSKVGAEKNREYLLEAIVLPSAKIAKGFETVNVLMFSGKSYSGIVRPNADEATILELMQAEGSVVQLDRDKIEETEKGPSAMPADLVKHLSLADLRDLVEYLTQQKTAAPTAGTKHE